MEETGKGKIYESIIGTMKDIGAVGKNQRNEQQKFMYRGIDAVMNALQPAMIKNGIFVMPEVLEEKREERTTKMGSVLFYTRLTVAYHFYAADGSSVSAKVIGEAMDTGDKATNKAMSIAYKYACFQVFCIPTEEMQDPDQTVHENIQPKNAQDGSNRGGNGRGREITGQGGRNGNTGQQVPLVDEAKIRVLTERAKAKGVPMYQILERYRHKDIRELTVPEFNSACNILEKMRDAPRPAEKGYMESDPDSPPWTAAG